MGVFDFNFIHPKSDSPAGSQDKMAKRRKALKSVDFQCFFFLVKLQNGA